MVFKNRASLGKPVILKRVDIMPYKPSRAEDSPANIMVPVMTNPGSWIKALKPGRLRTKMSWLDSSTGLLGDGKPAYFGGSLIICNPYPIRNTHVTAPLKYTVLHYKNYMDGLTPSGCTLSAHMSPTQAPLTFELRYA